MARGSVVKAIKAKPNERGRTSNKPLYCNCTKEHKETGSNPQPFLLSYPLVNGSAKPVRKCGVCFTNPPQDNKADKALDQLRKLGILK